MDIHDLDGISLGRVEFLDEPNFGVFIAFDRIQFDEGRILEVKNRQILGHY